jgi:hypothetical protein
MADVEDDDREWSSLQAEKYGRMHQNYLRDAQPRLLRELEASGTLDARVHAIGEEAADVLQSMMSEHMNRVEVRESSVHGEGGSSGEPQPYRG